MLFLLLSMTIRIDILLSIGAYFAILYWKRNITIKNLFIIRHKHIYNNIIIYLFKIYFFKLFLFPLLEVVHFYYILKHV